MKWWLRVVLTLVLAPPVWWILAGYVATQEGAGLQQWAQAIPTVVPQLYLVYTLPALLLCAVLFGIDCVLRLVSLDLLTVVVSPLVGYGLAWAAVRFIPEPHVQAAASSLPLFACYGLLWGLTIREPRTRSAHPERSSPAATGAALP